MKAVSREQAVAVMAVLMSNVNWDELDGKLLQDEVVAKPKKAGDQFTQFLMNGAAVIYVVAPFVTKLVDKFSHTEFLGEKWEIVERDEREDDLKEVDWSKVDCETCLKKGEPYITSGEKLKRLKAGEKIRYGGRAFITLWQDYQEKKEASVLEQLYMTKGITYVDFFGLVLQAPSGRRCVLCFYRRGDGSWYWSCNWFGNECNDRTFSVVSQVSSN